MMKRPSGLSVAEIIVAMTLIAVAVLAVIGLFTGAFKALNRSDLMTEGTEIAREVIEQTKLLGRDAPPPNDTTYDGFVPTPSEPTGFPPEPYPQVVRDGITYTVSVTVEPAPGTTNAKVLTVVVRWKETGRAELQTYL